MKHGKIYIVVFSLLLLTLGAAAQNTTYAPTSMFGIGELTTGESGRYVGMGGVGIALRKGDLVNSANPAAFTGLDTLKFIFDVGVVGAIKHYNASGLSSTTMIGNLNNVTMAGRILSWWYAGIGVTPYTSVGYAITIDEQIVGTETATIASLFEGSGGLYKINFTNAFRLFKNFSLGVNLSYITGKIEESETQQTIIVQQSSRKRTLYADFGLQYSIPLGGEGRALTVGAVYGYSTYLKQNNDLYVYSSSSNKDPINEDTRPQSQYIPQFIGGGVAYTTSRWTLAADYKYLDWSQMESKQSGISFQNQHLGKVGVCWLTGEAYRSPIELMAGAGFSNSYVVVRNKEVKAYYGSVGVGVPVRGNIVTVGLKYLGETQGGPGVQREQSVSMYLNLTFGERMSKSKLR